MQKWIHFCADKDNDDERKVVQEQQQKQKL